jgi:EamA-like transporter family protein
MGFLVEDRIGSGQPLTNADIVHLRHVACRPWNAVSDAMEVGSQPRWHHVRPFERHCYRTGTLGYYAALREQNASVVTPLTGVFPVLTVVLAFVVLRERLNKLQMAGMLLALASIVILSI